MNDHDSPLDPSSGTGHPHVPSDALPGAPSVTDVHTEAAVADPSGPSDGPADMHGDLARPGSPTASVVDAPADGGTSDGPADMHGDLARSGSTEPSLDATGGAAPAGSPDGSSDGPADMHGDIAAPASPAASTDSSSDGPADMHGDLARPMLPTPPHHAERAASADHASDASTEELAVASSDVAAAPSGDGTDAPAAAPGDAPKGPPPPKQRSDAELAALRRRAQESWQRVVAAKEDGSTIEGTVIAAVKGGALVDMAGVRGFLPASQVRAPEGGTLEALVKTKLALKILDTDAGRRRAVVSNRKALEEERRTKRADLIASLKVGERREGTVVRLADFGAFVDLGGVDGLIPMSELAQERVEKVGDVLKVGEKLTVEVLRVDEGGKKISLSRKNALPDPWRDHAATLRVGAVVNGTVIGFEPRFSVEIAPGVVGTIRDSDADPTEYSIGEAIEVRVRNVDRRTRRITLVPSFGDDVPAPDPMPRANSNGFAPLGVELQRSLEKARRATETTT